MRAAQPRVGADDSAKPPARLRLKLSTVRDVTRELGRLYREARAGRIDVSDASKLANILSIVGRLIADHELEARIDALERAAQAVPAPDAPRVASRVQ